MNALEAAIAKVEREIDQVEGDTNTALEQGRADDARQLRRKEEQLRRKEEQLRRKEEQLREKELIALRAPAAGSSQDVLQQILEGVREIRVQQQSDQEQGLQAIGFSKASQTAVNGMLISLGIQQVMGHAVAPLEQPEDLAEPAANAEADKVFPFERYANENAAASAFVEYHKNHLLLYGIKLGRGGYAIYDLHTQRSLTIHHQGKTFHGGVDAAVVPYGVATSTSYKVMRIIFEHKQSGKAKQMWRDANPDAVAQGDLVNRVLQYDDARPQAVCALLAASAAAQAPLLVDLTDGEVHHLLRLDNSELFVYEDCGPKQAYWEMARWLGLQTNWAMDRHFRSEPPQDIPDSLQRPLKRLREELLAESTSLVEDVSDVMHLSGLDNALQFACEAAPAVLPSMPDCVKAWYG